MENANNKGNILRKAIAILLIFSMCTTVITVSDHPGVYAEIRAVVLDANGGELKSKGSIDVDADFSELAQIADPTKTGHTFKGWYSAAVNGEKITSESPNNNDINTLYAQWTANTYTVTLNPKKGKVSKKSITATYDKAYGTLPKPTRTGYGFLGWFTGSGSKVSSNTVYRTLGNTTLYAKWGKSYKVKFDANNGSVRKKSKTVSVGSTYGTLPDPTRKGHTFLGWYTKKSGGTKITSGKKVNIKKDTTLYARWTLTKYTVKFDANGGDASKASKKVKYSKKYGELPKASRKGFTFKGWYTKKSGGNRITKDTVYKSTKGRTLYARWSRNTYTIKFNANGGKVEKKSKKIKFNYKYGSLPKPTRKNYKFKGWHTKKSGGTYITKSSKMTYGSNKTLYAKWAKISTVTFDYRKGTKGKKSKKIIYSEKYGSLPKTKRAGYTFKGWYTKKTGGTRVTSSTIVGVKKNIKLYAQWEFSLDIIEKLIPKTSKHRPGKALDFKGVTIHNTGNSGIGSNALSHATYLYNGGGKNAASWHYCVDDTYITRSIPESEWAYHAGSSTGNSTTIGIEICMNSDGNLGIATDRAAYLTAYILHKNGHTKAVHKENIFQHYDWSGKNCPEMIRKNKPYSWSTFIKKVNSYL